jgi:hypothetical protein
MASSESAYGREVEKGVRTDLSTASSSGLLLKLALLLS